VELVSESVDDLKAYIVECEGSDLADCVFAVDEESAREEFINKRDEMEPDEMGVITVTRMPEWDRYGDERAVPNRAWSKAGYATTCDKCGGGYDDCLEPCGLREVEGQVLCETCVEAYVEAHCRPCRCGTKPWAWPHGAVMVRCNRCGAKVTRDTVAAVVEAWNRGERDG
jgi:hypothetical protein